MSFIETYLNTYFHRDTTSPIITNRVKSHAKLKEVVKKKVPVYLKHEEECIPHELSEDGVALLKTNEGLKLKAYKDSVGVLTIGYGTSAPEYEWLTGTKLKPEKTITEKEAESLLHKWFVGHKIYQTLMKAGLHDQKVFDALCSFAYNVGKGGLTTKYRADHLYTPGFYTEKLTDTTHTRGVYQDNVKNIVDLIKNEYPRTNIACAMSWWRSPKVIRNRRAREIDLVLYTK